jgi:hypothetical protein
MLHAHIDRTTYVSMVTSCTDALSLCTECAFNMATLTLGLQVSRDRFRQRSDFCKRGFADIAFEQVCGKGESRPSEKRCAAEYRYLHARNSNSNVKIVKGDMKFN